jgi:electron transport complex protein RnfC
MKQIQLHDFNGGIHPSENKIQSTSLEILDASIPEKLILPIAQHIGAPSTPLVKPGDKVLKGQIIAQGEDFVSCNLHAPTSGTIGDISLRPVPHQSNMSAPCIEILTDGKDQWTEHSGLEDYLNAEPEQLIKLIQKAGITGLGGAGFPTHVKASIPASKINTVIINAAECEPYITSDDMLMREHAEEVIKGIEILCHILEPEQCLIGIENNKPQAIDTLQRSLSNLDSNIHNIQVASIPTKYPSGGEKQLIQILTGQEVPHGGLPADIGVLLQNVGTAHAIYQAIGKGEPLISRITTVTGDACQQPRNYRVLFGTPVKDLLQQANTNLNKVSRLVMGGPMMGITLQDTDTPVVKTTNCLIAASKHELPDPAQEQACIRCGMCTQACPAQLLPQQLYWFSKSSNLEQAQAHNIGDCIECGACSYVCPSNIPLVQYYRFAKGEIRQAQADKLKSDGAKKRFDTRTARLEREVAEKEAKRKARAEAAAKKQAEKKALEAANPTPVSTDVDIEALQKKLDATKLAIEKSKTKLEEAKAANSDKVEILQGALDKAQAKMKDLALTVAQAKKANKVSAPEKPTDPIEGLKEKVLAAKTRMEKAQERLSMAKEQNLDTVDALQLGLDKQKEKLDAAQKKLEEASQ